MATHKTLTDAVFRLATLALIEVYELTKDKRIHTMLEELAIIKRAFDVED